MAGEPLTPLDASFLQLEDRRSHMHVAAVLVFDGEAPPYDEFLDFVARRLHLVPRYRQKAVSDPLNLGRPRWIDDPNFDLPYHVRATALPRPAGEYELAVLAGRVFSQQLNRDKPLWEMWLVDGLEGGRHAVLSKTHHAVVDGISGLDILSVLFAPDEEGLEDDPWQPSRPPSDLELLADAVVERATTPLRLVGPALGLALRPERALGRVREAAGGILAMARAGLDPAPDLPYNRQSVGADRRYSWVRARLDDVKAIKNELGGTVNDVVLTVVTRGLRRDLERRGVEVAPLEVKAFVPISVRPDDARDGMGNQVSGMLVRLPVSCADPAECLHRIRRATEREKESGQAIGAQALTELAGFAPPNLLIQGARLAARQRFLNLVVTNVPGPQHTLDSGGRRLLDIFPVVPVAKNLGLGIAIASYDGGMAFGLTADFDVVPDVERLAGDLEAGLRELAEAAGVELGADGPAVEPVEDPGTRAEAAGVEELVARELEETGPAGGPAPAPEEEAEVVLETAEPGAEEGAGAEVHVDEPWPGYDGMGAPDVIAQLREASEEAAGVVRLYEAMHRGRREVLDAAERALARG
jgi:WS/DGAT/MGAT family acyltransferase